jgi:hypothetical protein
MSKTQISSLQIEPKSGQEDTFILRGLDVNGNEVFQINLSGIMKTGGFKVLSNVSVGTTQTAIAHGLGYTPSKVIILPRTNAVIWQSAVPDSTNIYLTASVAATCDIYVA